MPPREPSRRPPMVRPLPGSAPLRGSRIAGGVGRDSRDGRDGRDDGGRPPGGSRASGGGDGPRSPISGSTAVVGLLAGVGVALLVGAAIFAGSAPGMAPAPSGVPAAGIASPSPLAGGTASPAAVATPSPASPTAAGGPAELPLALVADVADPRLGISSATLAKEVAAGRVAIPCGVGALLVGGQDVPLTASTCMTPAKVTTAVRARTPRLGLLPATLVTPRVKVLRVAGADLFGPPSVRALDYPVVGSIASLPAAWAGFDPAEVRTLVSLGDSCPDRGVSHQANTLAKGWDWVLGGGTAKYTGTHVDRRFDGPDGKGWPVVDAVRTGNDGAVRALVSDAEITLDDFECPMTAAFRQHDSGTVFSIDPAVAPLLARSGVDVVTLASNHITDQGTTALGETLALFKANGIAAFGAGLNLAQAMKPAVIDVRGVRFAFVGFNEIPGSAKAGKSTAGVAWLTEANVRAAVAAARKVADVVIVVPQWGWPEYHADFTARQKEQMAMFWAAGADDVIGHGTHWAGPAAITKDDRGFHAVMASHGNFLFGQDWSRQTQEGVIAEVTFVGSRLAQLRLHPYVMLDQAQVNLTDPTTDGLYVLQQVWGNSILK